MRKWADPANIMTAWLQPPPASKLLVVPDPSTLMGWREICDQPMTNTLLPVD